MKRRNFLKALPLGTLAAATPFAFGGFAGNAFGKSPLLNSILNAQSQDGKCLVIINLQGGNDGLNCIIPYQDSNYFSNRPNIGFKTTDQSALSAYELSKSAMAFNPAFDYTYSGSGGTLKFMDLWNKGNVAVVQNVGYANPNLSHFRSTDIWNQATDSDVVLSTGWIGRYLEQELNDPNYPIDVQPGSDPLGIQIGPSLSPVFQGDTVEMGLAITDPSKYDSLSSYSDTPPQTLGGNELEYVLSILKQSDVYGARFKNLFPTAPSDTYTYPTSNPLAVQLQKVGWCIMKGMSTKVYFVNIGSFDTHVNEQSNVFPGANTTLTGQALLLNQLAEAVTIFMANLKSAGVDQNVVCMTYSEFGRRVNENASMGTDHGSAAPMFLFGTQVNGGIYGINPPMDPTSLDASGNIVYQYDFRQVYTSVLGDWFGVDSAMRKAILTDAAYGGVFPFSFPLNGSTNMQSLFLNPAAVRQAAPSNFVLYQNSPNPFNTNTTIQFSIASSAPVILEIFDTRGALIATPLNARLGQGQHQVIYDAGRLPSGSYYYRLGVGSEVQTRAMTLVK